MKTIYWTHNPGSDYERQHKGLLGEPVTNTDLYRVYSVKFLNKSTGRWRSLKDETVLRINDVYTKAHLIRIEE